MSLSHDQGGVQEDMPPGSLVQWLEEFVDDKGRTRKRSIDKREKQGGWEDPAAECCLFVLTYQEKRKIVVVVFVDDALLFVCLLLVRIALSFVLSTNCVCAWSCALLCLRVWSCVASSEMEIGVYLKSCDDWFVLLVLMLVCANFFVIVFPPLCTPAFLSVLRVLEVAREVLCRLGFEWREFWGGGSIGWSASVENLGEDWNFSEVGLEVVWGKSAEVLLEWGVWCQVYSSSEGGTSWGSEEEVEGGKVSLTDLFCLRCCACALFVFVCVLVWLVLFVLRFVCVYVWLVLFVLMFVCAVCLRLRPCLHCLWLVIVIFVSLCMFVSFFSAFQFQPG